MQIPIGHPRRTHAPKQYRSGGHGPDPSPDQAEQLVFSKQTGQAKQMLQVFDGTFTPRENTAFSLTRSDKQL